MEKIKTLIYLTEFKDKDIVSAFMKSTALKENTYQFDVCCSKEDFVVFSDNKDINRIENPKEEEYDFVLSSHKQNEDRLLFLNGKKKRTYLLILSEKEDAEKRQKSFVKAKKIVDDFFGKKVKFSFISDSLMDAVSEEEKKHMDGIEPIGNIFSYEKDMLVMSDRDFTFFEDSIACFSKLLSLKKEDKKSFFSSIGDFFFKNYTTKPENISLKDYLSVYEILLQKDNFSVNILSKPMVGDYFALLSSVAEKQ